MKTFTAKTLHDNPSEVYRAAVKEPVKITHRYFGSMILISSNCNDEISSAIEILQAMINNEGTSE